MFLGVFECIGLCAECMTASVRQRNAPNIVGGFAKGNQVQSNANMIKGRNDGGDENERGIRRFKYFIVTLLALFVVYTMNSTGSSGGASKDVYSLMMDAGSTGSRSKFEQVFWHNKAVGGAG